MSLPVAASHKRAVLSWDAVNTWRPSGLKVAVRIDSPCNSSTCAVTVLTLAPK